VIQTVSGHPEVIDIHVHFGSPPDPESGCFWSEAFEHTAAYAAMRVLTRTLFSKITFRRVKRHVLGAVNGSRSVKRTVLLALDRVYDEGGRPRNEWTHLYVPNDCIARMAAENGRVLFGASVHPYRPDWEEELDRCVSGGAVLCKWIPSAQLIRTKREKGGSGFPLERFYRRLADLRLPLLCHAGPEYTVPTSDPSFHAFNNPAHLRPALDAGVVVIVAHSALPYFWLFDAPDYREYFRAFLDLVGEAERRDWRLYGDLSALTGFFKAPYIQEDLMRLPHERLLFGSDYPVPLCELGYQKPMNLISRIRLLARTLFMKNPLDKNHALLRGMGFRDCVFTAASGLFAEIRRPGAPASAEGGTPGR
jgi:uncharacterized protein